MTLPLGALLNQALWWKKTKEGDKYWVKFCEDWRNLYDTPLIEHISAMLDASGGTIWTDDDDRRNMTMQQNNTYELYLTFRIVAKYYNRFGTLPSVDFLKEVHK